MPSVTGGVQCGSGMSASYRFQVQVLVCRNQRADHCSWTERSGIIERLCNSCDTQMSVLGQRSGAGLTQGSQSQVHRIRCMNERVIVEGSKGGTLTIAIATNESCKTAVKNECDKNVSLYHVTNQGCQFDAVKEKNPTSFVKENQG